MLAKSVSPPVGGTVDRAGLLLALAPSELVYETDRAQPVVVDRGEPERHAHALVEVAVLGRLEQPDERRLVDERARRLTEIEQRLREAEQAGIDVSELAEFAHERGALLFLDAIHEMPLDLQLGLLRNIKQSAMDPESESFPARRIVASTQVALGELVARGRFREDLCHRLAAIRIGLPPLRERREDIPLLTAHFIERLSTRMGIAPVALAPDEIDALQKYDWPGNVQELREVVEQILLRGQLPVGTLARPARRNHGTQDYSLDWTLEQAKRHHMARVLEACDGNKSAAARRLDISRKTLDRKLGTSGPE